MGLVSKPEDIKGAFQGGGGQPREKKEWEPPPSGVYRLEATEAAEHTSRAGNPCRKMQWEIKDGPEAGRRFGSYLAITEKALFKLNQLASALGIADAVDWEESKTWSKKVLNEELWADVQFERSPDGKGWRANMKFLKGAPVSLESVETEGTEDEVPF